MSGLTIRRATLAALALIAAAVVPVALAATPRNVTVSTVGGEKYVINRLAGTTMRFNKDAYEIKSGGTLTLSDRTRDGHTLSLVRRESLPRTARQINSCFENGICATIGAAHQFPQGDNGPPVPAKPVVDPDGKGLNKIRDSIYAFPSKTRKIKVSARAGSTLRFICIIHPWMQSRINVK